MKEKIRRGQRLIHINKIKVLQKSFDNFSVCDALRELVPLVQFKNRSLQLY